MPPATPDLSGICPCDVRVFPPKPEIPAGLSSLPRQLAGFPEYRAALLSHLASHRLLDDDIVPLPQQRPLRNWLAREGDDLGIMLLEMWAYVLDVLAFYEERIANESYLQTAQRDQSLRRLVELIGYRPRPATSASALLALIADSGKGLVSIPAGTAFRSSAFGSEPPQIFETSTDFTIDPALNRWTLAPIRPHDLENSYYLDPSEARVEAGDFVLFSWERAVGPADAFPLVPGSNSSIALVDLDQEDIVDLAPAGDVYSFDSPVTALIGAAAQLAAVSTITSLDGEQYRQLELRSPVAPTGGVTLDQLNLSKPTREARVRSVQLSDDLHNVLLDSIHSDIQENDLVIVSLGVQALPFRAVVVSHLEEVKFGAVPVSEDGVQPFYLVSEIRLFPQLPAGWMEKAQRLRVHYGMVEAGALTRPAKDRLVLDDLLPDAVFEGTVEPPEIETSGSLLLSGESGAGATLKATVEITEEGSGELQPQAGAEAFDKPLRTPVKVYGNVITATRGETVANEVLGSGDPAQAFQSFTLKKAPLTWFDDPSGIDGLRSTLAVRVGGILWKEVASFFGTGPQDEVFTIRENDAGESVVTFGDGKTGARLPGGFGNVTASYRHGAGAAKPPPHSITQIARSVKGLRQVANPVAPGGGSDADSPDDLRTNASTCSLLLGRAVSLTDFEALAREFGGVINAHAIWSWHGRLQKAVVKVWFISDGGSIAAALRNHLIGQSDPNVPIEAIEAQAVEKSLVVDLAVDSRYNTEEVELAVIGALLDPRSGVLSLGNIPIGAPLFRSQILSQIHDVPGVLTVRALRFDGSEAGPAMQVMENQYLDFSNGLIVGNSTASPTVL